MTPDSAEPFIVQPLLGDLYRSQDLLDLSAPGMCLARGE
jgi:hypothetical protein